MLKRNLGYPKALGLYDPKFEHDACGIGCLVQIDGEKRHEIVKDALKVLRRLSHRGGAGSDEENGDGAGILTQIPDAFFRNLELGFTLPKAKTYGVGMVFLPRLKEDRLHVQAWIENVVMEEGQLVLGWRYVPVQENSLSQSAKFNRPHIRQLFIQASDPTNIEAFERSLYVIRKRCEHARMDSHESDPDYFYFSSLSSKTIVYKGMLTSKQLDQFYLDLQDLNYTSAIALVHSRYSTNTFPSWERAHPYRMLIHNGEINTLRGNINRMKARQNTLNTTVFGNNLQRLFPIVVENGSDSAMFDNTLEFLVQSGVSMAQAIMMMIPEPWAHHPNLSESLKAFYAFSQLQMEAWDGPAAMAMSDGDCVAAVLDRNGLRPARYTLTTDNTLILASETGVLDLPLHQIKAHAQLKPGQILWVDTLKGEITDSLKLKESIATQYPYQTWLNHHQVVLSSIKSSSLANEKIDQLLKWQKAFAYTQEERINILLPMAKDGSEPIASMGIDVPLAVLSPNDQPLYNFFKQSFAQVTNPPIDALREAMMISTQMDLGGIGNILETKESDAKRLKLESPLLSHVDFDKILNLNQEGLYAQRFYPSFSNKIETALNELFIEAELAIQNGKTLLIISDRKWDHDHFPVPSLLALSALHQHLTNNQNRTKVSLIVETAEAKEVHHFALLLGYGASAIYPYLALDVIDQMSQSGLIKEILALEAQANYLKAGLKGIVKIMSKMGISTLQSYQGAQIFEAIGLSKSLIDTYFTNTISRVGGIGLAKIEDMVKHRIASAMDDQLKLSDGSQIRYREGGEAHLFNPKTIHGLQTAVRNNDYAAFKQMTQALNETHQGPKTLRQCLDFKPQTPIHLDEVEAIETLVKRFKTGAMSYGSISPEAHETLAIAMNALGGKSNTGEGGEDSKRYEEFVSGLSANSAIKQIASGRFGVTSNYLIHAKELQIKMAQGAKPGEGGQLPGKKVTEWIAKARHSTPGVGLISPPPHHDIYSIEDLAQLIHDLKNANKQARISVKLVSENGVGTIAAGVAKGRADGILISGYDGGTGASPLTSIQHAGLPWELGLAEAHQTLKLNHLRSRVFLETDGKLMSGKDVVMAALLGADEFGFSTAPLVALGCVMARVCHQDTCPMGIATQNPQLREKFVGKPEHVINFMRFIAMEVREIMASLGIRTLDELVGQSHLLKQVHFPNDLDLSALIQSEPEELKVHLSQNHGLNKSFDQKVLLPLFKRSLEKNQSLNASFELNNTHRVIGTQLGSEITRLFGEDGTNEDRYALNFKGNAGQSFGAFIPKGLSLILNGQANDYCGKGLSGGKIIVKTPKEAFYIASKNSLIGNVAFFGATSGSAFIQGLAGERFGVRNSGATLVVEGIGNHGCEYMTNGCVLILGSIGYNFAAGMSGGVAYVYDPLQNLESLCNLEMVQVNHLDKENLKKVHTLLSQHQVLTQSNLADELLQKWDKTQVHFRKVIPLI